MGGAKRNNKRGPGQLLSRTSLELTRDCPNQLSTLSDRGALTGGGFDPFAIDLSGHEAQIDDVSIALAEGRPNLVDGRESRLSIDLLTNIYAKARTGVKLGT